MGQLVGVQGNHNEAEELYDRLQDALEKALGRDHPALATRINSQSVLSERQVRAPEASRKRFFIATVGVAGYCEGWQYSPEFSGSTCVGESCCSWYTAPSTKPLLGISSEYAEAVALYERWQSIRVKGAGYGASPCGDLDTHKRDLYHICRVLCILQYFY